MCVYVSVIVAHGVSVAACARSLSICIVYNGVLLVDVFGSVLYILGLLGLRKNVNVLFLFIS